MATPRTNPIAFSEQDKASFDAAKQLPWTPPLLPLTIRRPSICDQNAPDSSTAAVALSPLLPECEEEPVTPRNQGIVMSTPEAPLCPPLLEQQQYQHRN